MQLLGDFLPADSGFEWRFATRRLEASGPHKRNSNGDQSGINRRRGGDLLLFSGNLPILLVDVTTSAKSGAKKATGINERVGTPVVPLFLGDCRFLTNEGNCGIQQYLQLIRMAITMGDQDLSRIQQGNRELRIAIIEGLGRSLEELGKRVDGHNVNGATLAEREVNQLVLEKIAFVHKLFGYSFTLPI